MLELEISEETLLRDTRRALEMMARLAALGVEFSLDDFGTGYSSLEQLRKLPVQTLKIDRSFVMNMSGEAQDEQVVSSIVALGQGLGLRVVAEGVESEAHLSKLREFGCDVAQGFHVSRPIAAEELIEWLRARPAGPMRGPARAAAPAPSAAGSERRVGKFAGRTF